jgi:hypothetical protein
VADVLIRPSAEEDAAKLIAGLRASDAAELRAYGLTEDTWLDAMRANIRGSVLCWTAEVDGELACVLGVAPISLLGGVGSPWMMGTAVLDANSRNLVRRTPEYISRMLRSFPHLVNFVHAENHTSVRWLRRLGFHLHPAEPFGALGEPFHKFEMRG